jgi:hypothetical protein
MTFQVLTLARDAYCLIHANTVDKDWNENGPDINFLIGGYTNSKQKQGALINGSAYCTPITVAYLLLKKTSDVEPQLELTFTERVELPPTVSNPLSAEARFSSVSSVRFLRNDQNVDTSSFIAILDVSPSQSISVLLKFDNLKITGAFKINLDIAAMGPKNALYYGDKEVFYDIPGSIKVEIIIGSTSREQFSISHPLEAGITQLFYSDYSDGYKVVGGYVQEPSNAPGGTAINYAFIGILDGIVDRGWVLKIPDSDPLYHT